MIKAVGKSADGNDALILGISEDNCRLLLQGMPIHVKGSELGVKMDVILFGGKNEKAIFEEIKSLIGPHTKMNVSDKAQESMNEQ